MPFITQGKTNLKYILIVVILAAIVGGGILYCYTKYSGVEFPLVEFPPKSECEQLYGTIEEEFEKANFCEKDVDCKAIALGGPYIEFGCYKFVNVATDENELVKKVEAYDKKCDQMINKCALAPEAVCISNKCALKSEIIIKSEYKQKEKITAKIGYDESIYVWGGYHWSIQKRENNNWKTIVESGCQPYFVDCQKVNFNEIKDCNEYNGAFVLCETPVWYEIDASHSYWDWEWDQLYEIDRKTFKCWDDRAIDSTCIVYAKAPPGKYKIILEYATAIENYGERDGADIKYAGKEFIIK